MALWKRIHARAGVRRAEYDAYFRGKSEAFAIELRRPRRVPPSRLPWRAQPGWLFLRRDKRDHLRVLRAAGLA